MRPGGGGAPENMGTRNEDGAEVIIRRGPWTLEEDSLLTNYIVRHGEGRWNMLAKCAGLKRTGKSCRLRWLNYLKPDTKRGNLTPQEQLLILELHSKWGNRWSKIAQRLPGRTDNEIKNYWRTRVQKQARLLNIESNGKNFLEAVRCFWTPRLIQKMEQTAPSNASTLTSFDFQNTLPHQSSVLSPPSSIPNCPAQTSTASPQTFENLAAVPANFYNLDFSEQLQLLQNPPAQFSGTWGEDDANVIANSNYNYYNLEPNCYDMVGNSTMASTSAVSPFYDSPGEYHTANAEWACTDLANTLWNMDDMWQIREELHGGGL